MAESIPRLEYPRPDRMREEWQCLNGTWRFAFDDADEGLRSRWHEDPRCLEGGIVVPFPYQSALSGIGAEGRHAAIWYARPFSVPESWAGRRVLLHFGAIAGSPLAWVNGMPVAPDPASVDALSADVTTLLCPGENRLSLRVAESLAPFARQEAGLPHVAGIWQSVWLEPVPEVHIREHRILPDIHGETVRIGVTPSAWATGTRVSARVSLSGSEVGRADAVFAAAALSTVWLEVPIRRPLLWSPEEPDLYNAVLELEAPGGPTDRIEGVFGMREVSIEGDRFLLNGRPYALRPAFDPGIWPDGLLAAPSDQAIRHDIEAARALGFNAACRWLDATDPRTLYWADRLGLLVWGGVAGGSSSPDAIAALTAGWQRAIRRDWNHPSVAAWAPWGAPRPAHVQQALAHLAEALDGTRPVGEGGGGFAGACGAREDVGRSRQTFVARPREA